MRYATNTPNLYQIVLYIIFFAGKKFSEETVKKLNQLREAGSCRSGRRSCALPVHRATSTVAQAERKNFNYL